MSHFDRRERSSSFRESLMIDDQFWARIIGFCESIWSGKALEGAVRYQEGREFQKKPIKSGWMVNLKADLSQLSKGFFFRVRALSHNPSQISRAIETFVNKYPKWILFSRSPFGSAFRVAHLRM